MSDADAMPTVFITGASRGVGAALAGRFAAEGWRVLASCRDPRDAAELDAERRAPHGVRIEKLVLDVSDFDAIKKLSFELTNRPIDVLLMNAAATGGGVGSFGDTDYVAWDRYHRVNSQAPMRLAECFVEQVSASRRKIMFAISSRVGATPSYGFVGYRASKSALNQVVFQLSLALAARGITCACAHPGWVRTRATGNTGALAPADSAELLFQVIDGLSLADTGHFFDPDGSRLPIVTQQLEARSYAKANP
jgi:NAD(P)-dependent dehydrogenase (short-subunit alcohol dehydrogenase family)